MRLLSVCLFAGLSMGGPLGCDNEKLDPMYDMEEEAADVTYSMQIKTILDTECISCHASGLVGEARNGAPVGVNFDTYASASAAGAAANSRIQVDRMPPSGALTPAQKKLFQQWVDNGLAE